MTTPHELILDLVSDQYLNRPCRICGQPIQPADKESMVFAGYSRGDESAAAHAACWERSTPKDQWAYPIDDDSTEEPSKS